MVRHYLCIITSILSITASEIRAQSPIGLDPRGGGIGGPSPYGTGFGLSPENAALYEQQRQNHLNYLEQLQRNFNQRQRVDQDLQTRLQGVTAEMAWTQTHRECESRLQALAAVNRTVTGAKEFIMSKDQITVIDGSRTMVYSERGLATVNGAACEFDRSKRLSDGIQTVFNSIFPTISQALERSTSVEDLRLHRERMRSHLETLTACRGLAGDNYVNEMISRYRLVEANPPSGAVPAQRVQ
jgi:hypothetical protein